MPNVNKIKVLSERTSGAPPVIFYIFSCQNAMNMMGESGVVSIKVMTNKFTGEPAGYGFINFDSDQTAIIAMHRYYH